MSEYELNLDTDEKKSGLDPIDVANTTDFTEEEKEILKKIEALTNECAEKGINCFVATKCQSQENPSAAWHFGVEPKDAYMNFAKHFAPLLLHITSNLTGTEVTAKNTATDQVVYQVAPSKTEEQEYESGPAEQGSGS